MTSIRQMIVTDVVTAVKTVAAFGNRVHLWRPNSPDYDLPYALILPERGDAGRSELTKDREELTVTVLIVEEFDQDAVGGSDGFATVDPLITAVQKAVMVDEQWGGKAILTHAVSWELVAPDEERPNEVRARVPLVISYRYDLGDPELDS